MSKSNPSEVKLAIPTSSSFSRLKSLNLQVFVMIAAIIAIMLFFTWTTNGAYLSTHNISNLLHQTTITSILTVGMVFIIISAEINLSISSMMGLLGGITAICDIWLGWPLPLTIIVTLVLGLLLSAWNRWWVTYHKVPSFIVTLTGMLAFHSILIGITNSTTVSPTSATMSQIGQSYLPASTGFIIGTLGLMAFVGWQWHRRMHHQALGLQSPASTTVVSHQALTTIIILGTIWLLNDYHGIPTPVLLLTLLLLSRMFMETQTAFGQHIYAISSNLEAAHLSRINIEHTKLAMFTINRLMVAITRLILSSQLGTGSPSAGNIAKLDTIAACMIGSTSLAGSVGSIARAVMGAFIMASLDNSMSMMDVPTFWQYIIKGAILLLAVWMDSTTKHHS